MTTPEPAAPVPPEAVTAAEAHVLHRVTMWRAAANLDSLKLTEAALMARRQLIGDVLDAGAEAIREDERDRSRVRAWRDTPDGAR